MEAKVMEQVAKVAEQLEDQIDAEMKKMDKIDEDELEILRRKRIEQMKQLRNQKETWKGNGHGEYSELGDEKQFFAACKKSPRLICHFYLESNMRCEIVDKHLAALARKHVESRFVKAKADKFPFLTSRLNIRVIPTVALVKDEVTIDYIRGFDDLGGHDEFTTEMMEWRIAQNGLINYDGDLTVPPSVKSKSTAAAKSKSILGYPGKKSKSNLRRGGGGNAADSDSSDDSDD